MYEDRRSRCVSVAVPASSDLQGVNITELLDIALVFDEIEHCVGQWYIILASACIIRQRS